MKNTLLKKITKTNKRRDRILAILFLCLCFQTVGAANNNQKTETDSQEAATTNPGNANQNQNQNQVKNQGKENQIKAQEKETTGNKPENKNGQGNNNSDKAQKIKSRFASRFGKMIQNRILMIEKMEAGLGKEKLLEEKEIAEIKGRLIKTKKDLNQLASRASQLETEDPETIKAEILTDLKELHGYSLVAPQNRALLMASSGKMIVLKTEAALVKIAELSAAKPFPTETQNKIIKLKEDLAILKKSTIQAQGDLWNIKPSGSIETTKETSEKIKNINNNIREQIVSVREQLRALVPELKAAAREERIQNNGQDQSTTPAVNPVILPEDNTDSPADSSL